MFYKLFERHKKVSFDQRLVSCSVYGQSVKGYMSRYMSMYSINVQYVGLSAAFKC